MTERLYPSPNKRRRRLDDATLRWRVDWELAFDGGGETGTAYFATRWGARLYAWYMYHLASYGGVVELTDQETQREEDR